MTCSVVASNDLQALSAVLVVALRAPANRNPAAVARRGEEESEVAQRGEGKVARVRVAQPPWARGLHSSTSQLNLSRV
jgi:hypothetical protein